MMRLNDQLIDDVDVFVRGYIPARRSHCIDQFLREMKGAI
jgi:metal-responsive CopG/Arc/MetJ family transcriptional regulator